MNASTRVHIRGSSLLLAGRLVSLALNCTVQVLLVRHLAKDEFGAFAYALAAASMCASVALLGLDKAVSRFVPIHFERGDYDRGFGTIALVLGAVLGAGALLVGGAVAALSVWGGALVDDPLAVRLLLILVCLAPLDALDACFQGLFAVLAEPKAIFLRRHLLAPGLRLAAVVAVIAAGAGPAALATAYVAAGVAGVTTYAVLLVRVVRRGGLWKHFSATRLCLPAGEVFGFALPLMTNDVVLILKSALVVMLLGYFWSTTEVAAFKAVWPIAGLNLVVMQSFKFLYTPLAARMYARADGDGIGHLYWNTAVWIAVLSFPIFAASFALARPLTLLLFGGRYEDSAAVLAVLAVGNYFNAALGFNTYTLRVYGKVGALVAIDLASALVSIATSLLLIPSYGALGAAFAVTITLVLYNLLNHAGLWLTTGVGAFERRYLRVYAAIAATTAALLVVQRSLEPSLVPSMALVAVASVLLVRLHRGVLGVDEMFPELRRIRLLRPIIGV